MVLVLEMPCPTPCEITGHKRAGKYVFCPYPASWSVSRHLLNSSCVQGPILAKGRIETGEQDLQLNTKKKNSWFKNDQRTFLQRNTNGQYVVLDAIILGLTFDYKEFISFVGVKIGTEQILDKELYSAFFQGQIRRFFALIDIFPCRNWMRLTLF